MANSTYISFDWAIKKLLRQKDNFEILEGFLSEFLGFDVTIEEILESEANKDTAYDKFDKVDILVKSEQKELILIELQYDAESDYFHRMFYGISKLVSQYISEGQSYGTLKKAYAINIVYFGLGEGDGYLYEYRGEFFDVNSDKVLEPSKYQKKKYDIEKVSDIFPKYYIINAKNFQSEVTRNAVEEWLYFLQNSEIPEHFEAKGINKARKKLNYEKMPDPERVAYDRFVESRRIEMAVKETAEQDGFKKGMEQGLEQGMEKGEDLKAIKVAKNAIQKDFDNQTIADLTGLSIDTIQKLKKS